MGYSSGILFLFICIGTAALANRQGSETDYSDTQVYTDDVASYCLTVTQYVERSSNNTRIITNNITSQFSDLDTDLLKLATKKDLDNSTKYLESKTAELLLDLAVASDVESLKNNLIGKMNALTKNVIDKHKEHLDLYNSSITDELILIQDQTLTKFNSLGEILHTLASKSAIEELQELMKTKGCDNSADAKGQHLNQPSKQSFEKSDIFGIISVVALVVLFILVCLLIKRISAIQNKLSSIQIQVAHERYYRRESDSTPKALQLTKPQEQRNGSLVANPVINMYEDSEMSESLMDKNMA